MKHPKEYKLVALREMPAPAEMSEVTNPEQAANYWRANITQHPAFNPDVENLAVLLMNARRKVMGHLYVSTGSLDTILSHPREIFRGAIVGNAAAIILMHNHPSGESSPSEADIKVTRDMIRAGQILKIELLDHVIVGKPNPDKGYSSLRELGYFYT